MAKRKRRAAPDLSWAGACGKTHECVLQRGHSGKCKQGSTSDEHYEVESILDEMPNPDGSGEQQFLIKWLNWPCEDSTWEPESALDSCKEVLKEWRQQQLSVTQVPVHTDGCTPPLRPGCVRRMCPGEGGLADGGNDNVMLVCHLCGQKWQSYWWCSYMRQYRGEASGS